MIEFCYRRELIRQDDFKYLVPDGEVPPKVNLAPLIASPSITGLNMKKAVICGSIKKASKEMKELEKKLREKGYKKIVIPIISKPEAAGIIKHFQAIKEADEIYFVNPKGMGINTTLELGYAVGLGKKCIVLYPETEEICRKILFEME